MARKEFTWSREQRTYLRKHLAADGVAAVSNALGKSKSAIHNMAAKLGRKRRWRRRKFSTKRPDFKRCRECGEWFSFGEKANRKQRFCTYSCAAKYRMRDPKLRKAQSRRAKALTKKLDMREIARAMWRDPKMRAHLTEQTRMRSNTKEHQRVMAKHNKKLWHDPKYAEFRKRHAERTSEVAKAMWSDPEFRKQKSIETTEKNRQRWADPKYKARVSAAIRAAKATTTGKLRSSAAARARVTQEQKERTSQMMKARWADPELRKEMTERSRETGRRNWRDPFYRARASERSRTLMQSPEHRARVAEQNRKRWADPEYVARQKALRSTPEFKARAAERTRLRWADPKFKARVAASISKAKKGKPTWRSKTLNLHPTETTTCSE
jgi:hypothetical protein